MKARCIGYIARPLERFLDDGVRVSKTLTRWVVPSALFVALAWLLARKIDLGVFAEALRLARWPELVAAALLAATACMGGLIARLYTLLRALPHDEPVGRWELASIHFASSAAHNLLPAPAGEVLRTVQLRRRHGYSVGALVAAQLIEKVIEALGLGIGTLVVASLGGLPRGLGLWMYAFAALGAGGAIVALAIGWRWRPSEAPYAVTDGLPLAERVRAHASNFFRRLGEGMHQLRSPSVWRRALSWSMLSDLANAITVGLCLMAVGVTLPLSAWFLLMLVARAAGLAPSTPGQFGVQEAGVVLALALLGVDRSRALAVAFLHHLVHFVPVTLIGLFELRRQWVPAAEVST
jgi:uncharacterized protein (TIRG00374 family)